MTDYEIIEDQAYNSTKEIIEKAKLKKGNILVVGCSTSEVLGSKIGTDSNFSTATAIYDGVSKAAEESGVYIAAQCCEHLNRAIVVERAAVPDAYYCNVVPQPKAGGSFATNAYQHFMDPVVLEHIKADAGIDIGLTLIGMHLKDVAVPVRLDNNKIGKTIVVAARVRPKYIGGIRAKYNDDLL